MILSALRIPARLDGALPWIALASAIWSFAAVALTGQLPLWLALAGIPLLFLAWTGEKRFPLGNRVWIALIALFLLFDAWIFAYIGRIDAIIYILMFLLAHKLWSPKKGRDILQIVIISFFFMLSASVMTTGPIFAIMFIIYVFLFTVSLVLLTMKWEVEALGEAGMGHEAVRSQVIPREFYRRAWAAVVLILGATLVIFFLFPRFSTNNYIPGLTEMNLARSGYSGEIRLGLSPEILPDTTSVMRVKVTEAGNPDDRPLKTIYLRGRVVETYNTMGEWRGSDSERFERTEPRDELRMDTFGVRWSGPRTGDFIQQVYLEPRAGRTIFALEGLHRLTFNRQFRMTVDPLSGTLSVSGRREAGIEILSYTAYSRLPDRSVGDPDLAGGPIINLSDPTPYLLLPEIRREQEIRRLAADIVRESGARTRHDIVQAVVERLRRDYQYALDGLYVGTFHPTEAFLLDIKRGHCEYFASGMAMLLRVLDIPCRIVSGYCTDRWNDVGKYFLVQETDAHVWVEVFFERAGWLAFEPSPPELLIRVIPRFGPFQKVINWMDAARMRWHMGVIDYNWQNQRRMLRNAWRNSRGPFRALSSFLSRDLRDLLSLESVRRSGGAALAMAGLAIIAVIGIGLIIAAGARLRLRRQMRQSRRDDAFVPSRRIPAYESILAALAQRGFQRPWAETPREYAKRVRVRWPELEEFGEITERYYRARYASEDLESTEAARFARFREQIRLLPGNGGQPS